MEYWFNRGVSDVEEGEVVRGRVVEVRDSEILVDIGYKSEGTIPIEEFRHAGSLPEGRRGDRGLPRVQGGQRRADRPLQGQGRQDQGLGPDLQGPRQRHPGRGPGRRGGQGRPRGRRGRARVPARLPGGPASGQEPGRDGGPDDPGQGDQAQPAARQRGALAARGAGRGARGEEEAHAVGAGRGHGAHRHREEPHRLRGLHRPRRHRRAAARHRHVVGSGRASLRDLPDRRPGRGGGAALRPRDRPGVARLQAEVVRPVGQRRRPRIRSGPRSAAAS